MITQTTPHPHPLQVHGTERGHSPALCLASSTKSAGAVHRLSVHPHRPDQFDALFADPFPYNNVLAVNDMFVPLQQHVHLWALLPRKRSKEIFDKMLEFIELETPEMDALYTRRSGPYERHALSCAKSLLMYRGKDGWMQRLQHLAYQRAWIGVIARTLLLCMSQKSDARLPWMIRISMSTI